jgi:uncharacterized protein (DUF169 family)
MDSRIAAALKIELSPVALLFADDVPSEVLQFAPGKWGCVMWLLANAARGKAAAASRETFGCLGGGVGLGFGNQYEKWPGGIGYFYGFLSQGNDGSEEGRTVAEQVRPFLRREALESFRHGEGYLKTPELARQFVEALPMTDIAARYVVFKPLADVTAGERPEIVVFLADPDRLAALVVLANYGRDHNENVVIPFLAGCQAIGIAPLREARSPQPRAVVGLVDLSARLFVAKQLGSGLFSFAVPLAMFEEMEGNVAGGFLERDTWRSLCALHD